jgi:hypothetical protein
MQNNKEQTTIIPSLEHFRMNEAEWIGVRQYFMSIEQERPVSFEEARFDYLTNAAYEGRTLNELLINRYFIDHINPILEREIAE